jgi:hypothetical protein
MPLHRLGALDGAPIIVSRRANPIRLAWTLASRHRVRHLFASRGRAACSIAAFVLLCASIAVATWQQLRLHGAIGLSPLLAQPFVAAIIATTIGWIATMRRRRRIERQIAQSWLASAPICVRDQRAALRWRVGIDVITPIAAVLAAVACDWRVVFPQQVCSLSSGRASWLACSQVGIPARSRRAIAQFHCRGCARRGRQHRSPPASRRSGAGRSRDCGRRRIRGSKRG